MAATTDQYGTRASFVNVLVVDIIDLDRVFLALHSLIPSLVWTTISCAHSTLLSTTFAWATFSYMGTTPSYSLLTLRRHRKVRWI